MSQTVPFPKRMEPLGSAGWDVFEGRPVPEIDWLIPGVLVRGGVTLFSGQGGKGKSLLCMQMQAALALGADWLEIPVKERMCSLALYCEDEEAILHRRIEDVRQHYGCSYRDLSLARFKSRVGEQNELMRFWGKKQDEGEITGLFRQVSEEIEMWGVRVLIIDTVADCFGGNENYRSQVRTFVNKMRKLVLRNGGGVILNAHPSRAGLTDGSGLSGSTGWQASVRTQVNLTEPKKPDADDESEQEPTRERLLKVMKNNYGPAGTKWPLLWDKGVFLRRDRQRASFEDKLRAKDALMGAARYLVSKGQHCAAAPGTRTSLTAIARQLSSCRNFTFQALDAAQEALLSEGLLVHVDIGPQTKRRRYIRPADMSYPDEPRAMEPA